MTYFKEWKDSGAIEEVTKEEARRALTGWWTDESLDDIFNNNKSFRLFTAYTYIWTKDDSGRVPVAGFYGVVE